MNMAIGESVVMAGGFRISTRVLYAALAVLGAIALGVLYVFDPREPGIYPVCPFFGLTGYQCPGCGSLRALYSLCHGNLAAAIGYNAFTALSLPFIGYSYLAGGIKAFRLGEPLRVFVHHRLIWALLVGIVAFWTLRNVPVGPLTVLAP